MPIPRSFLLVLMYDGLYLENGPESFGIIKKAENSFPAILRFIILIQGLSWPEPGSRFDWLLLRANPDSFIQDDGIFFSAWGRGTQGVIDGNEEGAGRKAERRPVSGQSGLCV